MLRFLRLFIFLCCLPLFAFCDEPEIKIEVNLSKEVKLACDRYNDITKRGNIDEAFLFFTDPHLLGSGNQFSEDTKNNFIASFDLANELFDTLKLDFCLCGGDWLNSGDTRNVAMEKLLFADRQMKILFPRYYKMMGNHDTNYQGIVSETDLSRGDFFKEDIDLKYFSDTGKAYYSFKTKISEFFILDSGLDWVVEIDEYRNNQIKWLSKKLIESTSLHKVIGIHMFYINTPNNNEITPMSREIIEVCNSFNTRKKYTIDELELDYSESNGFVHYILTGHCHVDFVENINGIPIIGTRSFCDETHPFDICVVDYDSGYLDLIRVGKDGNRRLKILNN